MTRTFNDRTGPPAPAGTPRSTRTERAVVLAGFAVAALWTAIATASGAGLETAGAAWLAAILWTVVASFACALRRGICRRDWSAFRRYHLPDGRDERIDWATQTGSYAWEPIAEEHERLMRGD